MPERDKKLIRAAKTARLAFPDDESRRTPAAFDVRQVAGCRDAMNL